MGSRQSSFQGHTDEDNKESAGHLSRISSIGTGLL